MQGEQHSQRLLEIGLANINVRELIKTGLVDYDASPTPSPPPSAERGEQVKQPGHPMPPFTSKTSLSPLAPTYIAPRTAVTPKPIKTLPESGASSSKPARKTPSGIRKVPKLAPAYNSSPATSTESPHMTNKSSKRRRTSQSPSAGSAKRTSEDLPQNLTHTAQSALPSSVLASEPITLAEEAGEAQGWPGYPGMTDDEVFRIVSRPEGTAGLDDWGIPGEVDPKECSEELQGRVANFLKLKSERGEHINTRLLSSAAFANPYIYSKLVDFVQISEHASQFPSSGWLTRRNIEAEIPVFGPAALGVQQKAKQDATRKAQEVGKRKEIAFKSGGKQSDAGPSEPRGQAGNGKWDSGRNGRDRVAEGDRSRARERDRNGARDGHRA